MVRQVIDIVREASRIMLGADGVETRTQAKGGKGNWVTEYDSRVQAFLKDRLLALLPGACFYGEEDEEDKADIHKGYAFIVDPIDGTANFTRGYRMSSISVALALDAVPVLGVVYNPYMDELFWAESGKGAYLNDRPIHVSDRTLEQSLVLFGTSPYDETLARRSFEIAYRYFSRAEDLRRSGSAAIDLCSLACGRADFYFELKLCPWDYAAGALIVKEAGGIVSDLSGKPVTFDRKQTVVARAPGVELLDVSDCL